MATFPYDISKMKQETALNFYKTFLSTYQAHTIAKGKCAQSTLIITFSSNPKN